MVRDVRLFDSEEITTGLIQLFGLLSPVRLRDLIEFEMVCFCLRYGIKVVGSHVIDGDDGGRTH